MDRTRVLVLEVYWSSFKVVQDNEDWGVNETGDREGRCVSLAGDSRAE